jgi:hypothetical protein
MNREGALHSSHNSIFNEQRVLSPKGVSTQKSLGLAPSLRPIQGTKKLSAEFHCLASASEFSLRGGEFTDAAQTVKTFFKISSPWIRLRGEPLSKERIHFLPHRARCQKIFCSPQKKLLASFTNLSRRRWLNRYPIHRFSATRSSLSQSFQLTCCTR